MPQAGGDLLPFIHHVVGRQIEAKDLGKILNLRAGNCDDLVTCFRQCLADDFGVDQNFIVSEQSRYPILTGRSSFVLHVAETGRRENHC